MAQIRHIALSSDDTEKFSPVEGQMVWQEVMNTKVDEPSNSMRIDIPKHKVLPAARRDDAVKYTVTGFLDPEPPSKLIEELLGRKRAR